MNQPGLKLVGADGKPIKSDTVQEEGFYETFEEWTAKAILTTNRAAWEYKNREIAEILKGFDIAVAEKVLEKNRGIKATLEDKNKTIEELKAFVEENIQIIQDLEVKLGEKGIIADLPKVIQ